MKPNRIIFAWLVITLLSGCEGKPQRTASIDDWGLALEGAVDLEQISDNGKGNRLLRACFSLSKDPAIWCDLPAEVIRDDTSKTSTYLTVATQISEISEVSYFGSEIYLKDCGAPIYLLAPRLIDQKNGNLVEGVVVLQGDEIVYERNFSPEENTRRKILDDNLYNHWHSTTRVAASAQDIDSLKKIKIGEQYQIKIIGSQGDQMADGELSKEFPKDVAESIAIYEKLSDVLRGNLPVDCK